MGIDREPEVKGAVQQSGFAFFFFLPKPNTSPVLVSRWFKHFPNAQSVTDCGNPAA